MRTTFHAPAPGLGGDFPGRREPIRGGCGKNILFFTPRKIPSQSRLLVIGLALHEYFRLIRLRLEHTAELGNLAQHRGRELAAAEAE
jgi:hypothetical protein